MEQLREVHVETNILASAVGPGPCRILSQSLLPELLGDAPAFERTETGDTVPPIPILAGANCRPVSIEEFTNAASDHANIVRPRRRAANSLSASRNWLLLPQRTLRPPRFRTPLRPWRPPRFNADQRVGTRRFSSSSQFWTSVICVVASDLARSTIMNRPSGATS